MHGGCLIDAVDGALFSGRLLRLYQAGSPVQAHQQATRDLAVLAGHGPGPGLSDLFEFFKITNKAFH